MAELQLPKLIMRVRFPSFAPSEHKNRTSEIRRPQPVDKPQTTRAIRPGFSHVKKWVIGQKVLIKTAVDIEISMISLISWHNIFIRRPQNDLENPTEK